MDIDYGSSTEAYSSSSRKIREFLAPEETYLEPAMLMAAPVLVYTSRQPWILSGRHVLPPDADVPTLDAASLAAKIARRIRFAVSAEMVYVKTQPWGFECWIVLNNSTEEERFRLYDIQWALMEQNPATGFKFHLIDRQNRLLSDVLTLESVDGVADVRKA